MSSQSASAGSVAVTTQGKYNVTEPTYSDGAATETQTDVNGNTIVVGNRAHDAVDAGAPVKVGGKASDVEPTPVAVGDRVNAWFDQNGRLNVLIDGSSSMGIDFVTPGSGANNLGKDEDAAHASGDTGVMALAVRNDAGTVLAGTTGDYIPFTTDSNGNLRTITNLYDGAGSAVNKGQAAMAGSLPVVLASDQSAIPVTQSGTWNQRLQDGSGSAVNKGQAAMAASLPVVLASDQSAIPVTQSGTWNQRLQDGSGSAVNKGQGAMAASLPVVLASDQSAIPVTQSGTWNQRLQDGSGSAVNKGQAAMAASLPVVLASDQSSVPVTLGRLSVVDQIDTSPGPVWDYSSTNINSNVGAFTTAVAVLAAAVKQIRIADTGGLHIGVYTGGAGAEALAFIIEPGMADVIEHTIAASTRISVRAMGSAAISSGLLTMQFLG